MKYRLCMQTEEGIKNKMMSTKSFRTIKEAKNYYSKSIASKVWIEKFKGYNFYKLEVLK